MIINKLFHFYDIHLFLIQIISEFSSTSRNNKSESDDARSKENAGNKMWKYVDNKTYPQK